MKYFSPETYVFRMKSEQLICATMGPVPGSIEPIGEGELEE